MLPVTNEILRLVGVISFEFSIRAPLSSRVLASMMSSMLEMQSGCFDFDIALGIALRLLSRLWLAMLYDHDTLITPS